MLLFKKRKDKKKKLIPPIMADSNLELEIEKIEEQVHYLVDRL